MRSWPCRDAGQPHHWSLTAAAPIAAACTAARACRAGSHRRSTTAVGELVCRGSTCCTLCWPVPPSNEWQDAHRYHRRLSAAAGAQTTAHCAADIAFIAVCPGCVQVRCCRKGLVVVAGGPPAWLAQCVGVGVNGGHLYWWGRCRRLEEWKGWGTLDMANSYHQHYSCTHTVCSAADVMNKTHAPACVCPAFGLVAVSAG